MTRKRFEKLLMELWKDKEKYKDTECNVKSDVENYMRNDVRYGAVVIVGARRML